MKATELLDKQIRGMNATLHEVADDLSESEWRSRPSPMQNIVAFSVWHIPRVQDNFLQVWVRGLPEVCTRERWKAWHPLQKYGAGIGIMLHEADLIAHRLVLPDVLAYADEVTAEAAGWLHGLTDDDLDGIPDVPAHLAPFPEYRTEGYQADTDHLLGKPIWRLLSSPCISHVRGHMGELALQKAMLREPLS